MQIIPMILAGGSGTRLWPRSRSALPKQFLNLTSPRSLLIETAARFADDPRFCAPVISGAAEHSFMVAREFLAAGIVPQAVIAEPEKRNTAPAIAAAAALVAERIGGETVLCILPSDHIVRDAPALRHAVLAAAEAASGGRIVTIGITPSEPATGYGYIEVGEALGAGCPVHALIRFVEKPGRADAEAFVRSGRFVWNAGMFVARADVLLAEMDRYCPDVLANAQAALDAASENAAITTLADKPFAACPSISFDYAVMEKTHRAAVIPAEIGWTDVGSWSALWEVSDKDNVGNAIKGDVVAVQCQRSHLESEGRLLVGIGLEDMMVVQTRDATLVAPLARAQDVGGIVGMLAASKRSEIAVHSKVQRPWGWYDSLWQADGYQVKQIMVAPGAAISLQLHHHRSEHWVVLRGRAKVTRDDEVFELVAGQSAFIPAMTKHRLENSGSEELHVIEVQLGDYLGEDDIVRFEDIYGRVKLAS